MKLIILLLFMLSSLQGCYGLANVDSNLVGSCNVLVEDAYLFHQPKESSYFGRNVITHVHDLRLPRGEVKLGILKAGTKVIVNRVMSDSNGSWGQYFRMEVKISSGQFYGTIADIPSCAPHHSRPSWVNCVDVNKANDLVLKREYLVDCSNFRVGVKTVEKKGEQ